MKKTFLYVLMAAAALTTTTLAACSDDDDDDIDSTETEAYDGTVGNISEYIMENVVVYDNNVDDAGNITLTDEFLRWGLYGGDVDPDDASGTVMRYYLQDGDTYESIFRSLVPDAEETKITGTAPNLTYTYTQDGQQYTLKMTEQSDGVLISLPNAAPWNAKATALRLLPASDENAIDKRLTFYTTGQKYRLIIVKKAVKMFLTTIGTKKTPTVLNVNTAYDPEISLYCFGHTNSAVYFFMTLPDTDLTLTDTWTEQRYVAPYKINTNMVYDYGEKFLPKSNELLFIKRNLRHFCEGKRFVNNDVETDVDGMNEVYLTDYAFDVTFDTFKFATCETTNSLVTHKKVMYVDFSEKSDSDDELGYMRKNSSNLLRVLYYVKVPVSEIVAASADEADGYVAK